MFDGVVGEEVGVGEVLLELLEGEHFEEEFCGLLGEHCLNVLIHATLEDVFDQAMGVPEQHVVRQFVVVQRLLVQIAQIDYQVQ